MDKEARASRPRLCRRTDGNNFLVFFHFALLAQIRNAIAHEIDCTDIACTSVHIHHDWLSELARQQHAADRDPAATPTANIATPMLVQIEVENLRHWTVVPHGADWCSRHVPLRCEILGVGCAARCKRYGRHGKQDAMDHCTASREARCGACSCGDLEHVQDLGEASMQLVWDMQVTGHCKQ